MNIYVWQWKPEIQIQPKKTLTDFELLCPNGNIPQTLARSFLSNLNANCHFLDVILLFHRKPS